MGWHCGTCKNLNRGRYKECQECGKPKEGEPFVDLPDTYTTLTDAALIKQATAGSDWECAFCKSHQRRDNGECAQCGARQGESRDHKTEWDDGTVGPSGSGPTEQEAIEAEFKKDNLDLEETIQEGAPRKRRKPSPKKAPPQPKALYGKRPEASQSRWRRYGKRVGIGLGAFAVICLLYLIFRTRIVEATVTDVRWTYTIQVERQVIERQSGFDEDQPHDAFEVTPKGHRHHHYRKVKIGTKQVPYTESYTCGETCTTTPRTCTSNKNGFKTCTGGDRRCSPKTCTRTKYRTEDVYKDESVEEMYYGWKVWRWHHNRNVVTRGTLDTPYWPTDEEVALNKNLGPEARMERVAARDASHLVLFQDDEGERHEYKPKDVHEFMALRPAAKRRIRVGLWRNPEIQP